MGHAAIETNRAINAHMLANTGAEIRKTSEDVWGTARPPHNGSRISGEPLLENFGESTAPGARLHESPYPKPEGRRIEGGGARDGLGQGSSVCIRWLCGEPKSAPKRAV